MKIIASLLCEEFSQVVSHRKNWASLCSKKAP